MESKFTMKCPVCDKEVDMFDICDKCNYQNSGPKEKEEDPLIKALKGDDDED